MIRHHHESVKICLWMMRGDLQPALPSYFPDRSQVHFSVFDFRQTWPTVVGTNRHEIKPCGSVVAIGHAQGFVAWVEGGIEDHNHYTLPRWGAACCAPT